MIWHKRSKRICRPLSSFSRRGRLSVLLSWNGIWRLCYHLDRCGARLIYLPPYSPDLNPIEKAWSKFKQFLRTAKARTADALDQAITEALKTITAAVLVRLVSSLWIRDTVSLVVV